MARISKKYFLTRHNNIAQYYCINSCNKMVCSPFRVVKITLPIGYRYEQYYFYILRQTAYTHCFHLRISCIKLSFIIGTHYTQHIITVYLN